MSIPNIPDTLFHTIADDIIDEMSLPIGLPEDELRSEVESLWRESDIPENTSIDMRLAWVSHHLENWLIYDKGVSDELASKICEPWVTYRLEELQQKLHEKKEGEVVPFRKR